MTDTGPQLDEIDSRAAHLDEYEPLPDEADIVVGTDVPALLVEIRELTAERDRARRIAVALEQENAHQAEQIDRVRAWAISHEYRWLHELLDGYGTHGGHL